MMIIKDFYYSQEDFILERKDKGYLITKDIPAHIDEYYNTEQYISHTNSKKSLFEKIYFLIQKFNFWHKYKIISASTSKTTLLDFGSGNGAFAFYMKKKRYDVSAYDPISSFDNASIPYYSDINSIQEKFDIITLWHVLEHVPSPEDNLQFLQKLLQKNGKIIIALPNYNSFDAKYYQNYWAAWDVPRHLHHFSRKGAIHFFEQNNLTVEKTYPLFFDSFYVSIISASYKNSWIEKLLSPFIGLFSLVKGFFTKDYSSIVYVLSVKN